MKFKIGDKVKVVANISSCEGKDAYIGCIFTIDSLNPNILNNKRHYGVKENCNFVFYDDELELLKKYSFTKFDLENKMVVELRNGLKGIIVDNLIIGKNFFSDLTDYNDDLTNFTDNLDIIKVYDTWAYMGFEDYLNNSNLALIWERKEPVKMTKEEIESKLGYEIEIV